MFVNETLMKRGCLWQWGLVVHVLPRFLLKCHFGIICVQLQQKTRPVTTKKPGDVIMLILADTQRGTYTFHFKGSEESAGHGHAERDGENENERQCQRKGAHLHHPQDSQADQLDQSEEMHPQCRHLHKWQQRRVLAGTNTKINMK